MGLPSAREALNAWLQTRGDKNHYGDQPYPVFFVTAAGGGMYAAHHAASVLARLQDRCPNFAQHVFSISAVSGGSLGAAVFASLANHFAPNASHQPCRLGPLMAGPMEQRVQKYFLDADLLAPVVAASLFPDSCTASCRRGSTASIGREPWRPVWLVHGRGLHLRRPAKTRSRRPCSCPPRSRENPGQPDPQRHRCRARVPRGDHPF